MRDYLRIVPSALLFTLAGFVIMQSIVGPIGKSRASEESEAYYMAAIQDAACFEQLSCGACLQGAYPNTLIPPVFYCWATKCSTADLFKTCKTGIGGPCYQTGWGGGGKEKGDTVTCKKCIGWNCGKLIGTDCTACSCAGTGSKEWPSGAKEGDWSSWPTCY